VKGKSRWRLHIAPYRRIARARILLDTGCVIVAHSSRRARLVSAASIARHRIYYMLGLILAGEAVYTLPFHVTRFFRPSVLEVFGLSNTELGAAQAVYGVVAMLAYFPGGRWPPPSGLRRPAACT
jgi:hypothetical protein